MLLSHVFSDMFDDMFIPSTMSAANAPRLMNSELREYDDHYELHMELAGFKKEDIHVDVKDNTLSITAERHSEYEQKEKKNSFLRCERSFGSYSRSFDISGIDCANIKAGYKDGVLTLTLPKQKKEEPTGRRLEIE